MFECALVREERALDPSNSTVQKVFRNRKDLGRHAANLLEGGVMPLLAVGFTAFYRTCSVRQPRADWR